MTAYSIDGVVDIIHKYLKSHMDDCAFRFKSNASTDGAYEELLPTIYKYTFDGDEIDGDGLPIVTPAVLIQVTSLKGTTLGLAVSIICYDAFTDKREMFSEVQNGMYKRLLDASETGEEVVESTFGARRGLYVSTLLLSEVVYNAIYRMSNDGIPLVDIEMQPPNSEMEYYPYCAAAVTFNAEIGRSQYIQESELHKLL